MKEFWPEIVFTAAGILLWCSSCVSPAPPPLLPVHSVKTITTICPGPLCAICATTTEAPND